MRFFSIVTAVLFIQVLIFRVHGGSCIDNLAWKLSHSAKGNLLFVSGTGDMCNFSSDDVPWANLSFVSVEISDGVTSVGSHAFERFEFLESVVMSDTVKAVHRGAFIGCANLTRVQFSNNLEYIGDRSFSFCEKLESVWIPASVKKIGKQAFANDVLLQQAVLSRGLEEIEEKAFWNCSGLMGIRIPDSVIIIGDSAFAGCSSLGAVSIPDSIKAVGAKVFDSCTDLSLVFYQGYIEIQAEDVFLGCDNLNVICVSPDYNSTSLWGKSVVNRNPECTSFRHLFNRCYKGSFFNHTLVQEERRNVIEMRLRNNGCASFDCNNDTGIHSWSLCNGTGMENGTCVNGQCLQSRSQFQQQFKRRVEVVFQLSKKVKAVDIDLEEFRLNLCKITGKDPDALDVGYEVDEEGYVIHVFVLVEDDDTGVAVAGAGGSEGVCLIAEILCNTTGEVIVVQPLSFSGAQSQQNMVMKVGFITLFLAIIVAMMS